MSAVITSEGFVCLVFISRTHSSLSMGKDFSQFVLLVSVGHLCILPERFAKKDLNRKYGHCFLRFIGKLLLILTNYTWLERGDSQL